MFRSGAFFQISAAELPVSFRFSLMFLYLADYVARKAVSGKTMDSISEAVKSQIVFQVEL